MNMEVTLKGFWNCGMRSIIKSNMFLRFLLVVGLTLTQTGGEFINEYDKPMNFKCPDGQLISYLYSEHSDYYDDRRWEISCRADPEVTTKCTQSDYFNDFEKPMAYSCPPEAALAGIESVHENTFEDRRFKFICCNTVEPVYSNCYVTKHVNEYDKELKFTVPDNFAIRTIFSTFDTQRNDRSFKFELCSKSLEEP